MTRAEEINVKILYEILDTRDPRLVRSRDPPHSLPPWLHSRKLHISSFTLLLPPRSLLLFNNYSTTMTSLNVARHSREPVRVATPSRKTAALHGAIWLAHLWPQHPACRLREEVSAGRLIEIEGGPPAASAFRSLAKAGLVLARLQSTRDTSYLFRRRHWRDFERRPLKLSLKCARRICTWCGRRCDIFHVRHTRGIKRPLISPNSSILANGTDGFAGLALTAPSDRLFGWPLIRKSCRKPGSKIVLRDVRSQGFTSAKYIYR